LSSLSEGQRCIRSPNEFSSIRARILRKLVLLASMIVGLALSLFSRSNLRVQEL
jgi:hypothetical protein